MASSIIHMAVANEINKKIKRDSRKILIGSIAPDLSKIVGETKEKSHFLEGNIDDSIPSLDKFLSKYRDNLDDDFILGYYIHLYTDYFWFKYFLKELIDGTKVTKLNGETVNISRDKIVEYIYSDYTDMNIKVIDKYNLDLKIFFEDLPRISNIITEIPMEKLDLLIEKMGIIIENSKEKKNYLFEIENVDKFIKTSVELILSELEKLNIK